MQQLFRIMMVSISIFFVSCNTSNKKEIDVAFRFDDFSATSNTNIELKIIDAFKDAKSPFTIGVIPYVIDGDQTDRSIQKVNPLSAEKANVLITGYHEGIIDVALHGYSHQANHTGNGEFHGLDYQVQFEKIFKGKELLENLTNIPINTFVPPWNAYDLNTIKALNELNFHTLSAQRNKFFNISEKDTNLNFIPYTCELFELKDAINEARNSNAKHSTIVVLFHAYDFKEINKGITPTLQQPISLHEFQQILSYTKNQKDVNILSLSQLTKSMDNLNVQIKNRKNRNYWFNNEFLPDIISNEKLIINYQENYLILAITKIVCFYLVIFLFSAVIVYYSMRILFNKQKKILKFIFRLTCIVAIACLIYIYHDFYVHLLGIVLTFIVLGVVFGLYLLNKNKAAKI